MEYVGPRAQYDVMGATQFRLLCTMGLRDHHKVLDFGCGSLRAGRLLIPYLNEGCYSGVEPNRWLVEKAIEHEIGQHMICIKKPVFLHNSDFSVAEFGMQFDFILAQSIFSHAGTNLMQKCLKGFRESLKDDGILLATFVEFGDAPKLPRAVDAADDSVYPRCLRVRRSTIKRLARDVGFLAARLPWYHPRQTWYALAKHRGRLPSRTMCGFLHGAVLFEPDFKSSWHRGARVMNYVKRHLPQGMKGPIKRLLRR
jgi:SAM-dependent methyltransferase